MKGNKGDRILRAIAIMLVVNLVFSLCILGYLVYRNVSGITASAGYETQERYTLYIGTNDKDSHTQVISTAEAQDIVDDICADYTVGYTRLNAVGGWVDETGDLTHENTLIYEFYNVSEEQLKNIMDDILVSLNQSTILVEKADSEYTFYSAED